MAFSTLPINDLALIPSAFAMRTNSGTSSRRSRRSYFETNDWGLPMRWASSCCVRPAHFRASTNTPT